MAPSASTAKRDSSSITSPGAACPAVSKDTGANCAAVVNSDDPVKLTTAQPQPGSESRRTSETAAAAVADENVGGGASGGALSGRHRWVKGAPLSPVEGEKNSNEWSSSTGNQSGSDSDDGDMATSADCGGGLNKIDSTEHRIACDRLQDTKLQNGDQSRATQESRVAQTQPALLVKVEASTDSHDADEDDWLHAGNNTGGDLVSSATSGVSSKTAKNRKKKSKASKAKAKSKSKKATTCTPALETAPCAEVATLPDTRGKKSLNVTFSHVRMLEFTRDVGGCAVPSDGTWGLALGLPFRETMVDVDGYEASKAEVRLSQPSHVEENIEIMIFPSFFRAKWLDYSSSSFYSRVPMPHCCLDCCKRSPLRVQQRSQKSSSSETEKYHVDHLFFFSRHA